MERNKIFKKLLWILGAVATVFAIVFAMGKFDGEKANAAVELNRTSRGRPGHRAGVTSHG
mgnify:CR=1 FL=1